MLFWQTSTEASFGTRKQLPSIGRKDCCHPPWTHWLIERYGRTGFATCTAFAILLAISYGFALRVVTLKLTKAKIDRAQILRVLERKYPYGTEVRNAQLQAASSGVTKDESSK